MPATDTDRRALESVKDEYKYGWSQPENYVFKARKGLDHDIIDQISAMKREPAWMRQLRHEALDIFFSKPIPTWAADLSDIKYDDIFYYIKPTEAQGKSWDDVPPDIKETFDKLGIPEAERKFLAGVGAQYECLSGDTRVATARGLIPIREVEPGDTVFAFDEAENRLIPAPVKAKMPKGEREVFEVRVRTHTIRATANHPFLTLTYQRAVGKQRGRYTREWKYLQDLKPGDLVAVAKQLPDAGQPASLVKPDIRTVVKGRNQTGAEYDLDISHSYNPIRLPDRTSADLMWWLGLYIGDGFIHYQNDEDKARVEFAIPATDAELRAEFKRVTEKLFEIPATNGDPNRMTVYSTVLARYLEANGFGGKALTKSIPEWVHTLPEAERLAFLGGYADADGYVRDHPSNHDMVLTSGNRKMLEQVQSLALQSGLQTSTIHHFASRHPFDATRTIDGYRMQLSGEFDRLGCRSPQRRNRLGKRRFSHDFSSIKGSTFKRHTNEFIGFARIESITPAGIEPVFDIEVDGPHNFVAEGLIVHNSEAIYHSLKAEWEKQGVIFVDSDSGLREHEDIYREYFGTVVPSTDNVFAALNTAAWSGGSFVYVPKGVHLDIPLQAYFRINAQSMGQFERTLIIVDEGASVHYVEGCFLAGARVRTRTGETPIEQIAVGDEVLTHRGRYRKVYHTMQRPYQGLIYHIRYFGDSGQELQITEEHPLLVVRRQRANERNRKFTTEWLTAAEVKPGDYLAIPVPRGEFTPEHTHHTTVLVGHGRHAPVQREVNLPLEPDMYRLLGYYFSEGHVDNEHYLTFSFNASEKQYLEDVKELAERYFGLAPIENAPRQNGQTLVYAATPLARTFATEFGSTVYTKNIPEWLRNAPNEHLAELVRGMWCGDGSYDPKKNMFRFNTVSRDLAYAFRDALLRLGIAASVNPQQREAPRKDIYAVVISSPWNAKFGAIVGCPAPDGRQSGSPFYLDQDYLYVPIRSVEVEEMATTVYNFSVEEDESYIAEGVISHNCTAPTYSQDSLHSGVIEIIVRKNARCRYTTIQNWSHNVYNLVTQRSLVYDGGTMEWVDANLGSKVTMKYPSVYMLGEGAKGNILSMAFAGTNQHLDTGGKLVHAAPNTSSQLISKSISKNGGRASYRGLLKVAKGAHGAKSNVVCDALLLDEKSRSDTYPYIEIDEDDVTVGHEASVSKIGEEQLFYLMSRGLSEDEASAMIVSGFIEPMVKELPMEYAVEMNRLIQLQMEGSIG